MAGYIGSTPVPQGIKETQSFTATAGQTTFNTLGYSNGNNISVFLNGVRLINGTDYTATNGSDIVLTSAASASDVLDFETFNEFNLVNQNLTTPTFTDSASVTSTTTANVSVSGDTTATVTLKNNTHEDTDGGRESTLIFQGEQTGGEISTLAEIEASHDGTADDEKGDLIFRTNDGSDGASPTEAARIDSGQNLLIGTTSTTVYTSGSGGDAGVNLRADGQISNSSNSASVFNRMASDGPINLFYKDGSEVGRIGTNSSRLTIGNGDTGLLIAGDLDNITPFNTSTNASRDNAVDLGNSGVRFKDLYLSGGVYLGGTGASNKLEDYEEGTWTPQCNTGTINSATGNYTKIGRVVHITAVLDGFSNRTSGNGLVISNLPFAIGITNRTYPSGIFARDINQSPDAVYSAGSDSLTIYSSKATGAYEQVLHNDLNAATSAIYFSTTYYA